MWLPAASALTVKNVTSYVSRPVLIHCPCPGLSRGEPNDSEVVLITPPSAVKLPRPTNGGGRGEFTVLNQAPTMVFAAAFPCPPASIAICVVGAATANKTS